MALRARFKIATSVLPAAKKYVSGKNRPSGLAPGAPRLRHQLGIGQVEHRVLDVGIAAQRAPDVAEGRAFDDHERRLRDVALRELGEEPAAA